MRLFFEEWHVLETDISSVQTDEIVEADSNSSVLTDESVSSQTENKKSVAESGEIRSLEQINISNFPTIAFLSISFTHHTAILANVKSLEQRKFYI